MEDIIIIVVLCAIIGLAIRYIIKQKKKGKGCIGCPCSGDCHGKCKRR